MPTASGNSITLITKATPLVGRAPLIVNVTIELILPGPE